MAYAPEKVFVHLDRTYFAVGETIWMKGYVESAVPVPDTSRYLYVELLDSQKGEAKLRTKIRLGEDGFAGHMDLPEDTPGGRYFNGTFASIGFKAMAPDGRSVDWEGALYDDAGVLICDCHTEHAGMGLLGFTPQEGRRYRLISKDGGPSWPLPEAAPTGAGSPGPRSFADGLARVLRQAGASRPASQFAVGPLLLRQDPISAIGARRPQPDGLGRGCFCAILAEN